jgi:isocitrate/isopropylmalate dehydrogenase
LQELLKFIHFGIFGLKICHPTTLILAAKMCFSKNYTDTTLFQAQNIENLFSLTLLEGSQTLDLKIKTHYFI